MDSKRSRNSRARAHECSRTSAPTPGTHARARARALKRFAVCMSRPRAQDTIRKTRHNRIPAVALVVLVRIERNHGTATAARTSGCSARAGAASVVCSIVWRCAMRALRSRRHLAHGAAMAATALARHGIIATRHLARLAAALLRSRHYDQAVRGVHLAAFWKMRGEVGKGDAEVRSLKRERALQSR